MFHGNMPKASDSERKFSDLYKLLHNILSFLKERFWRFIFLIRKMSIQKRLLISFLFASILPLLIVSVYSSVYTSDALTSKISASSLQFLNQTDKSIRAELARYEEFCNQMAYSDLVQESLLKYDSTAYTSNFEISKTIVEELLGKYFTTYLSGISLLNIYTMEGDTFFDLGYDQMWGADKDRLIALSNQNDGYDVWTYAKTVRGTDCLMMCRRIINKNSYSQNLGYFIVGINKANFSQKVFADVDLGVGSELFILDENGIVMSGDNPSLQPGKEYYNKEFVQELLANEKAGNYVFRSSYGHESFLAAFTFNSYAKWYQVAAIPYSYINAEATGFRRSMLMIGGAFLLFALVLALSIYYSIVSPLKKMVASTAAVSRGDFNIRTHDGAMDEVGYLSQRFDIAVEQVSKLIETVKKEQIIKRQTEIQMLQAQINPHFLFNTLNSLKWTAMMCRAESVSDGLGALAEILKNTIIDENSMVPLKSEMKNIENYLMIQKIRYGNLFETRFEIDRELLDCPVLKFILQPIAENSVIHGFEGIDYHGVITVSCVRSDNVLLIRIADNGLGFDPDTLEKFNGHGKNRQKLSSIGIWNVQERIRMNFGDEYGLEIDSGIGLGTVVTVRVPYMAGQGGASYV